MRAFTPLEAPEVGAARLVECAHLAVEHGSRRAYREGERASHIRETGGEIVAVATAERRLAGRDPHERAVAVPLRFEGPAAAARERLGGRCEHGCQVPAGIGVAGHPGMIAQPAASLNMFVTHRGFAL